MAAAGNSVTSSGWHSNKVRFCAPREPGKGNGQIVERIRIAIVDDHALLRRGLRETLAECRDFEVIGEGATADEAVSIALTARPDVMLLDINMPGDGMTALERIVKLQESTRILMLSVDDNLASVRTAMTSGASGYILKGVLGGELLSIIRGVHAGGKHVASELAARLFSEVGGETGEGKAALNVDQRRSLLTNREKQILELIRKGLPNADIAKKLKLSEATIKHYITPMFRKLAVKNRTEAAVLAGLNRRG